MTYIVANKAAYRGHENEDGFDELFNEQIRKNRRLQEGYDNGCRTPAIRADRLALEKRLPDREPDYLMTMYDNKTNSELGGKKSTATKVSNLAHDVQNAEGGYQRSYNPSRPSYSKGDLLIVSEAYGVR